MKIKTETEFVAFNDGVCNIFSNDYEDERLPNKYTNLGFSKRVLGFKRFFEASARQIDINRVIRIPLLPGIDNYDYVEIDSVVYGVKMVQEIYDTNPPCIDLTLDKVRV
jgi:hypothetical protein